MRTVVSASIALAFALLIVRPVLIYAQTPAAAPSAEQGEAQPSPAPTSRGVLSRAGYGALAVVENVGYVPAKLGYGLMGAVVGTLTFALTLGDKEAAKGIWQQAFGGDYVLTPSMVAGDEPINFSGPAPAYETVRRRRETPPSPEGPATPGPGPVATQTAKSEPQVWWRFWSRSKAAPKAGESARETPSVVGSATPHATPVATPSPVAKSEPQAWWRFWSRSKAVPKAAETAHETPTSAGSATPVGNPTPLAKGEPHVWWHFW